MVGAGRRRNEAPGHAWEVLSRMRPMPKQHTEKTSIPSIGPDVIRPLNSMITANAGIESPRN